MDVNIQTAIIAGVISIFIALISFFIAYLGVKAQMERFRQEQSRGLATKIYDRRLEIYPAAFAITEKLDRSKGLTADNKIENFKTAGEKMTEWHGSGAALIMSGQSIKTYYLLLKSIGKQPAEPDNFSEIQLEKIRNCRSAFRLSLRKDIGMLHDSADSGS